MGIDTIARKVIPGPIRRRAGAWSLHQVSRSMRLLGPYVRLVHGYSTENLIITAEKAEYEYCGHRIAAPRDGTGSFFEVFYENVYDHLFGPKAGDAVIDVGAYVGMWTVRAALNVGEKGRVIAIEPDAANLWWLRDNVAKIPTVTVLPYLASDHDGKEMLYLSSTSSCHSTIFKQARCVETECHTIDWITYKQQIGKVGFIKIDAEGAELKVLEGAQRILRGGTKLAIAIYRDLPDGTPGYPDIAAFLEKLGYIVVMETGLRRYLYAQKAD